MHPKNSYFLLRQGRTMDIKISFLTGGNKSETDLRQIITKQGITDAYFKIL